jgi:hypothetical protein
MTADIINLRQARKQKARADKDIQASENRAKFGRSKVERQREATESARVQKLFDGHKVEPDDTSKA